MGSPKRRVALFLPSLAGGGAERSMLQVACGLAELNVQVDMVLAKAEGPYLKQVPASVNLVDLHCARTLASLPALARYLRRERPEALLASLEHANLIAIGAAKLARVKTRVFVRLSNHLSLEIEGSRKRNLEPMLVKLLYPGVDGIISVSEGAADDLANMTGIARNRISVIYNPVVTPELPDQARQPVDHPWFGPDQPPVLLAVGRLTSQKDYPNLLKAFAQVRKERLARLIILGEGEERPKLEALREELGLSDDVDLPGFKDNPFAYMSRAALFVLASRFEGLPGVLIQALACGTPVVSTDCPSGPREILAGGKWGALIPVGEPDALACAILKELQAEKRIPPRECLEPFIAENAIRRYRDVLLPQ